MDLTTSGRERPQPMPLPRLRNHNASRQGSRAAPKALCRWLATGVVVAASLAVSACGESESPTILNTEKVERAIEQSIREQRGKYARVSCPSGVHQKKGVEFACTAVVNRRTSTRFVVTQRDDSGRVRYEAR